MTQEGLLIRDPLESPDVTFTLSLNFVSRTWPPHECLGEKFILNHGGMVNRSDSVSQHVNIQNLYHRCSIKGKKASGTESIFEEKMAIKFPKFSKRNKPTDWRKLTGTPA